MSLNDVSEESVNFTNHVVARVGVPPHFTKTESIKNWGKISDEEIDECKKYIRSISNIEFDKVAVLILSGMVRIIAFITDGLINRDKFIAVHVGMNKYKIMEGDFKQVMEQDAWIIF